MVSNETTEVIRKAKLVYEQQLRPALEQSDNGHFVAIEPDSGEHFVAESFDEAVRLARTKHPSKLTHTIRIGHATAFHLGGCMR